jgi:parallel beta-helix repeat protein
MPIKKIANTLHVCINGGVHALNLLSQFFLTCHINYGSRFLDKNPFHLCYDSNFHVLEMGEQRTAFVLLLILCFTIVAISEIGIVQAQNTIYIRADGSVEGTDKIQRDGEVYTLISDISDSIVVERDNVVLNGAGYTLQGDGNENGITLNDVNNITVKRLKLTNFNIGIVVMGSNDNRFLENTITDNFRGLDLTASRNNTIFGSYIANNTYGIALENQDNIINNNTIANNSDAGIFLYGAGYNIIFGNNLTDNNNGVYLSISSYNGIFENNITDNNRGMHFEQSPSNSIYSNNFVNKSLLTPKV